MYILLVILTPKHDTNKSPVAHTMYFQVFLRQTINSAKYTADCTAGRSILFVYINWALEYIWDHGSKIPEDPESTTFYKCYCARRPTLPFLMCIFIKWAVGPIWDHRLPIAEHSDCMGFVPMLALLMCGYDLVL